VVTATVNDSTYRNKDGALPEDLAAHILDNRV